MSEYQYVLDNRWAAAREPLAMLETVWDPWTLTHLDGLQVSPGWHCLEVAGGGGSIIRWLSQRVGEDGRVLATDLERHFLSAIEAANLEVHWHDILTDVLPEAAFDLVHARFLLTFLPDRQLALGRMVSALKPGG